MPAISPYWPGRNLDQARREFERWRQGRRRGERIPLTLWRTAVGLAAKHGVSKTSQALHLDYYALQRRLAGTQPKRPALPAEFVEVSLLGSAHGARCQIEICAPSGGKVRVDLAGLSAAELATFVRRVSGKEPCSR